MAQDVKKGVSKAIRTNTIPLIAIMTAVTTVVAMFVKVPTPGKGYLNLSDTMIYFSAYAFGPWVGGIIGGLGPALSDLISGYPQWAIFTLVIDGVQALLVGFLARRFEPVSIIVGSVAAGAWKVFGYFIAGWILSGMGPALVRCSRRCARPIRRWCDSVVSVSRPVSDTLLFGCKKPVGSPVNGDSTVFLYVFTHIVSVLAVSTAGAMG